MAAGIQTVSSQRVRTECKFFSEATIGAAEAAYNTYEGTQAADATKTWTTRIVNSFYDGTNYILIAESSYPERNTDPLGQVPIAP